MNGVFHVTRRRQRFEGFYFSVLLKGNSDSLHLREPGLEPSTSRPQDDPLDPIVLRGRGIMSEWTPPGTKTCTTGSDGSRGGAEDVPSVDKAQDEHATLSALALS